MTHKEFINQNQGKFLERVDSTNKNQCMDLAIAYCEDVLGTPRSIFSGIIPAHDVWDKPTAFTGSRFDFIKNQPWAIPKQGDVIVFDKKINGGDGHIAVVDTADLQSVTVISQNDPTGSPIIMKTYTYDYVSGWLRLIQNTVSGGEIEKLEKQILDLKETEKRLIKEKDNVRIDLEDRLKNLREKLAQSDSECQIKIKAEHNNTIKEVQLLVDGLKK